MVKVAIYGAGIAGLSAAHELIRSGFRVDVYEAGDGVGGKARSQYLAGTGSDGRRDLPGEHGFRFFPAFYRHLDETMAQIPTEGSRSVLDNLVPSEQVAIAGRDGHFLRMPRRPGGGTDSVRGALAQLRGFFSEEGYGFSASDALGFAHSIIHVLTSCPERREHEYDERSWFDFARADAHSENYRRFTATMPRTLVAMDGERASAFTVGKVGTQLMFVDARADEVGPDRVLNAPTEESWLGPWRAELERRGVRFHMGAPLEQLRVGPDRSDRPIITGALCGGHDVRADFHVAAVPVEVMAKLVTPEVGAVSPALRTVKEKLHDQVAWMAGAQVFLKRRALDLALGHVVFRDSEYALTAITQGAFWRSFGGDLASRWGAGDLVDVLSIDISDWDESVGGQPPLRERTRQQVIDIVLSEVRRALEGDFDIPADDILAIHLDENIVAGNGGKISDNTTPLFIHTPGFFRYRPKAQTEIENLTLAADYVRTFTNLATMEGANEAAKRAATHIYERTGTGDPPGVYDLEEPAFFELAKKLDRALWKNGLPHVFELGADQYRNAIRAALMLVGVDAAAQLRDLVGAEKNAALAAPADSPLEALVDAVSAIAQE